MCVCVVCALGSLLEGCSCLFFRLHVGVYDFQLGYESKKQKKASIKSHANAAGESVD